MIEHIDDLGTPNAYNHYAVGWAHAMDTPYQWTKQVASHWGGTRNGTIVHWPNGIAAKGEIRHQFDHVHRRRPDRAGGGRPAGADAGQRRHCRSRCTGVSMAYAFDDAGAAERHETQYFEMVVQPGHLPPGLDRGHPAPAPRGSCVGRSGTSTRTSGSCTTPTTDWTQAHDLAAEQPEQAGRAAAPLR